MIILNGKNNSSSSGYLKIEDSLAGADARNGQAIAMQSQSQCAARSRPVASEHDADWEGALERYKQKVPSEKKLSYRLRRLEERDPRWLEAQHARRRVFFAMLKDSYADRGDTYFWAVLVLLINASVLMPFFGVLRGALFATFVTLSWTVLHKVRRV